VFNKSLLKRVQAPCLRIGKPLNLSAREAAAGIRRIVDERMADEVRVFAAKRGLEPREFTLLPFGGAGAVHAAAVAAELGIARILVPPRPGAFSALGLLCSDVVHDFIRSELRPISALDPAHGEDLFLDLEARAREVHGLLAEAGIRSRLDTRNEKVGKKIREATLEKIPYMLVIGGREVEEDTVSVRERSDGDLGASSVRDFVERVLTEVRERR